MLSVLRGGRLGRRVISALSGFVTAVLILAAQPALAADSVPAPPVRSSVDPNGVDLISGRLNASEDIVSIGQPGSGGITYRRYLADTGWRDDFIGTINSNAGCLVVSIGATSVDCNTMATAGATLVQSGSTYTFTSRDGTVSEFSTTYAGLVPVQASVARITSMTYPNGERLTFHNTVVGTACIGGPPGQCITTNVVFVTAVTSNRGYQVRLATNNQQAAQDAAFAINMAVDWCDPTSFSCTGVTQPVETMQALHFASTYTFSGSTTTIETPEGVTRTYTIDANRRVTQVTNGAETWTYSYADASDVRTTSITLVGEGLRRRVTSKISTSLLLTDTIDPNGLNLTTTYTYNTSNLVSRVTQPEGNYTEYEYDARGNVRYQRQYPKPGTSPPPALVVQAIYPSSCTASNFRICNQPTAVIDARASEAGSTYQTDYTYDPAHGGVLTVTAPSPDGTAARPQTRYSYDDFKARYRNSSASTIVEAPTAVYLLTQTSACSSGVSPGCLGTADETRTSYIYGPSTVTVANNLLLTETTIAAGNSGTSGVYSTTQYQYDTAGNQTVVIGPRDGADDTTYRYDNARRLIGVISPDPDASGPRIRTAIRTTYSDDSEPTLVEVGTVTGTSNSAWTAFVSAEQNSSAYNAQGRLSEKRLAAGGATYSVVQYSYDSWGREECVAARMNPSLYGSLGQPSCTQKTPNGASGPDRIARSQYDNASRVIGVLSGVDTVAEQAEVRRAYTPNGRTDWIEDANGNRTDQDYDRFDRVYRTYFPSTTLGAHTPSTTDYEQYGYDANGNVTSLRLRSGSSNTLAFAYDRLNRLTNKSGSTLLAVNYAWDQLSRPTSALYVSGGQGVTYSHDALGRTITETAYGRALTSRYDRGGLRDRLTYPDGAYVDYVYDIAGNLTDVRENGATSGAGLTAIYTYDDLGRATSLTRGNGTATTYTYDPASRLETMVHNLSGTASDLTYTFTRNPVDQTTNRASSNSSYNFAPAAPGTTTYNRDGLNRYTSVAGTTFSYDGRSNLTSDGSRTFGYDLENHLTSVSGSASMTLAYDPLGRLRQTISGGQTTQFLYDGDNLVAEYNGSRTMLRRYSYGIEVDTPAIWYEGAGFTTNTRNWLYSDELGSVIATAPSSGTPVVYRYDAYGRPQGDDWSGPRFRYTGQIALGEVELYHYKARVYDPVLGRFLQTDPISYAGGMNLYAYVANDPVNFTDPLGLQCTGSRGECPDLIQLDDIVVVGRRNDYFRDLWRLEDLRSIYDRNSGLIDFAAGFVPGYDLARCALWASCDALDWGLAAAGAIPGAGRVAGLGRVARACFCVTGETLVATPDGQKAIRDMAVGDLVLSFDESTGTVSERAVTAVVRPPAQPTWLLEMSSQNGSHDAFRATAGHPWLIEGRGWTETQDLNPGDRFVGVDGQSWTLTGRSVTGLIEETFTLEVSGLHTYIVGDAEIVVHNGGICSIAARSAARRLMRSLNIPTSRARSNVRVHSGRGGHVTPDGSRQQMTTGSNGESIVLSIHPADANHAAPHVHAGTPRTGEGPNGPIHYNSLGGAEPF